MPTTTIWPSGWRRRRIASVDEAGVGVEAVVTRAAGAERLVEGAVGVVAGERVVAGGDDLAVGLDGDRVAAVESRRDDLAAVAEGRVELVVGRRGDTGDVDVRDVGVGDGAGPVGDGADLHRFRRLGVDGDVVAGTRRAGGR